MRALLPRSGFWSMIFGRPLTWFFEAIQERIVAFRTEASAVYKDLSPSSTRQLSSWVEQHGITFPGDETSQREAVDAAWKYRGGMSVFRMNDVLHANGFALNVYESFLDYPLTGENFGVTWEPLASVGLTGYTLANRVAAVSPAWLCVCGEDEAYCDEEYAHCGDFLEFQQLYTYLPLPAVASANYLQVWGGGPVNIPAEDRRKLEELVMRIRPLKCHVCFLEITYV